MKTLVVAPAWVGDMVMSQVVVAPLRKLGSSIDFLAPASTYDLIGRMPGVSNAWLMPLGHGELGLSARRRLGHELRAQAYDRAIVLPNTFKSALVPWFARIGQRTGWLGEHRRVVLNDVRRLDPEALPRMVDRFLALVDESVPDATPVLAHDADNGARLLAELGLETPAIAICPGAEFGPAKQWPAAHFRELLCRCVAGGSQVWLLGSAKDRRVCEEIAAGVDRVVNLAGRTTLPDAVDLLALADTVVTNDSGLMHIAAAVGSSVVALFGSTTPDFTPPLSPSAVVMQVELDCRPCFSRTCPLGHTRCLTTLSPERVFEAVGSHG